MSRYFSSSVATAALLAVLAGPVLAQEAPAQPAEQSHGQVQVQVAIPQALQDAGLTDVTGKPSRHGQRIEGKLPDGTEIGAILDESGELRGLRSHGEQPLPATLVERLVPQTVRNQPIFAELGQVQAIFINERGVMLAGSDAQSNSVRAAFAEDGTLLRFGRGDDRAKEMGGKKGKGHGPKGDEHGAKGHKGPKGDHMREHKAERHGEKGERGRQGAPRAQGDMPPPPASGDALSPDQVRSSLSQAGYTSVGQILQQGPITIAQATNPEGEPVLVEIAPNGDVVRELNR
ncbi:hypothetical protein RGQ15_10415 [Paracoccus sp. MBLB3053]|uniref:Uncharacterized protein n=1 Tax=Paracoccus aurantius TaxID=3073814 RepID=A0ABU2HSH3_9RHOB|nr:hypothetical protein [Paracoccus sp. MBLB3053]MDS9467978.1 hypothetical protein [Paracoccus sp. MBLB3053]